jgi:hypothetical protein
MNDIPWYGWLIFALLGLLLFATNWSLISTLKARKKTGPESGTARVIHQMGQSIRNPWQKENEMLADLSRRTAELRPPAGTPQNPIQPDQNE